MKQINKKLKLSIILILTILLFFIIYDIYFFKPSNEGFTPGDIDNMFSDVKQITSTVNNIPNEINNIDNKLTNKINDIGNTIEKKTEAMGKTIETKVIDILTSKLKSIFTQLGEIFKKGLIDPILNLFVGIGNIFVQLFNILMQIGNKIGSLPNCITTYMMKETLDTFNSTYKKIVPGFFRNIISSIYNYTFIYFFNFIGNITGYTNNVKKCYEFNISNNVDKINSNLKDINSSFKNDFGKLNFSEIKI